MSSSIAAPADIRASSTDLSGETPLSRTLKAALLVEAALVFITAVQLVTQSSRTDRYFAWTIKPPITAAFLAACYLSALLILLLAASRTSWDRARVAISPVLVFLPLMMIATLVHLDRFHLNAGPTSARIAGWGWLVLYTVALVIVPVALFFQRGGLGLDRTRARPLLPSLRLVLALQAAVLIPVGIGLFIAPGTFDAIWPWNLTPLTGRTVGAWLTAVGVGAVDIVWTNDQTRVRMGGIVFAFFGGAQILAVLRYPHQVDWSDARTLVYLGFLATMVATGVAIVRAARDEARGAGYVFLDEWDVDAPIEPVFDALADARTYPEWWRPVYITSEAEGPPEVGCVSRHHFKGRLPYTLKSSSRITALDRPHRVESEVEGDLSGHGIWTLTEGPRGTHVRWDWHVNADRPLLRYLTPVLRPLFRWNHHWAVQRAIEGLEPYAKRPR